MKPTRKTRTSKRFCALLLVVSMLVSMYVPTAGIAYAEPRDSELTIEQLEALTNMGESAEDNGPEAEPTGEESGELEEPDPGEEPGNPEEPGEEPGEPEEPGNEEKPEEPGDTEEPDDDKEPGETGEPGDGEEPDSGEESEAPDETADDEALEAEEELDEEPLFPEFDPVELELIERYSVAYDGLADTGSSFDQGIAAGSQYQIKGSAETGISHPLLDLVGWNTVIDDQEVLYRPGDVVELTENLILYARWEFTGQFSPLKRMASSMLRSNGQVSITYHSNSTIAAVIDYAPSGEDYSVLSITDPRFADFEIEGYSLYGWNTRSDYRGTTYRSPDQIFGLNQSIMLYAMWRPIVDDNYYVYYDGKATSVGVGTYSDDYLSYGDPYQIKAPGEIGIYTNDTENYDFAEWNTAVNGTGESFAPGDSFNITEDLILIAQWQYKTIANGVYMLNPNGGTFANSALGTEYVPLGTPFVVQSAEAYTLSRENYTFTGVMYNNEFYGIGEYIPTLVSSFYFLTAVWEYSGPLYELEYHANNGSGGRIIEDLLHGEAHQVLDDSVTGANVSRPGYHFDGWNTAADGSGDEYLPGETFTVTDNAILYAQWDPDLDAWATITYDGNGGTSEDGASYDREVLLGVQNLEENLFTRDTYLFTGWNTEANGTGDSYADQGEIDITGNITLYAQWDYDRNYWATITYDGNGGTSADGDSYDREVLLGVQNLEENHFTRDTYLFTGWNTAANGTGESYADEGAINIISNITLYAQWDFDREYWAEVTYKGNGGTTDPDGETEVKRMVEKGSYNLESATLFKRDTYVFDGWLDDAEFKHAGGATYLIEADTTFTAQWDFDREYWATITYDGNGGASVEGDSYDRDVLLGVQNLEENHFTRDTYLFTGWNTATNGTGDSYADEGEIDITGNITLYAQWDYDREYWAEVTYEGNGGATDPDGETEVKRMVEKGSYNLESATLFERATYEFTGWLDEANVKHAGGATYLIEGDTTFVAQWDYDREYWAEVTYEGNGGATNPGGLTEIKEMVEKGSYNLEAATLFARTGHLFAGWEDEAGYVHAAGATYTIEGDTIFVAQWNVDREHWAEVTYKGNGGATNPGGETEVTRIVEKGVNYNLEAATLFERATHVFNGWKNEADDETHAAGATFVIEDDMTFEAQWDYDDNYWAVITYHGNGGLTEDGREIYTERALFGQMHRLMKNEFVRQGYDFDVWTQRADGRGLLLDDEENTFIIGNLTLYAQWEYDESVYTITYNPNSEDYFGTPPTDGTEYKFGQRVTVKDVDDDFGRVGYWFLGWSEDASAEDGDPAFAPGTSFAIEDDVVLYAIWWEDPTIYRVTYDGNYQTSGTPPEDEIGYRYNQEVVVKGNTDLRKVGHVFKGWSFVRYNAGTPMVKDDTFRIKDQTTLYAAWWDYDGERISVTYNPNSGEGEVYTDGNIIPDEVYTFLSGSFMGISKADFHLISWNTKPDGTGVEYVPGAREEISTSLELFAQWSYNGNSKYSVTYYPGTGRGSHYAPGFDAGDVHQLIDPADYDIVKNYHEFAGWDTMEDGTGIRYQIGDAITVTADVKLYAQWEYHGDVYFSVTYDNQMGQFVTDDMLFPGDTYVVRTPESVGFVMAGMGVEVKYWFDAQTNEIYEPGEELELERSYTLKAAWGMID